MTVDDDREELRTRLTGLSRRWHREGLGSREALAKTAADLLQWQQQHGIKGLWAQPPMLVTATLDDAIGQGLGIIHLFAEAMGLVVLPLGLRQPPAAIVAACRKHRPRFLGLTVLWGDTEADLAEVGRHLPPETRLIAGGPAFTYDPGLAGRCGVYRVAPNVAFFIDYVLTSK